MVLKLFIVIVAGLALAVILSILMMRSQLQLKALATDNPLYSNSNLREFVHTKPPTTSKSVVVEVAARLNIVNAPKGEYELLVLDKHAGAKALKDALSRIEHRIMILQYVLSASYARDVNVDGHIYNLFTLKRLADKHEPTQLFSTQNFGSPAHYHIFILE